MDKFQFVWWHEWQGLHFKKAVFGMALVYDWYLWFGFLEIRKWHNMKPGDIKRHYQEEDDVRL